MSLTVTKAVWKHSKAKLNARLVLLALADYASEEKVKRGDAAIAYPSQQTLADMCGCSRSTVELALVALEEAGEIERTGTRHWGKYRGSVEYEVLPAVDLLDDDLTDLRSPDLTDSRSPRDDEDPYLTDSRGLPDRSSELPDRFSAVPDRPVGHKPVVNPVVDPVVLTGSRRRDVLPSDSTEGKDSHSLDADEVRQREKQRLGEQEGLRKELAILRAKVPSASGEYLARVERSIRMLEDQLPAEAVAA